LWGFYGENLNQAPSYDKIAGSRRRQGRGNSSWKRFGRRYAQYKVTQPLIYRKFIPKLSLTKFTFSDYYEYILIITGALNLGKNR